MVGVVGEAPAGGYDPKKTLTTALRFAAYAAGGVLVADQVGLTSYLYQLLPPQYTVIGGLLIGAAFKALENALKNWNR